MDSWDLALLAIVGYVAVISLARLMIRRRDQRLQQFREQMKHESQFQKKSERRQSKEETPERRRAG